MSERERDRETEKAAKRGGKWGYPTSMSAFIMSALRRLQETSGERITADGQAKVVLTRGGAARHDKVGG